MVLFLIASFGVGCVLEAKGKDHCVTTEDCVAGTCYGQRCVFRDAGVPPADASSEGGDGHESSDAGETGDGRDALDMFPDAPGPGDGGYGDVSDAASELGGSEDGGSSSDVPPTTDGGGGDTMPDPSHVGTCALPSSACPLEAQTGCTEVFCGGRLWVAPEQYPHGRIPYRISDPEGKFSTAYREAIRRGASLWSLATGSLVTFDECTECSGRFVSVVPGEGDGLADSGAGEHRLPMPIDPNGTGRPSPHRIAHQFGHALGLDDTFKRADRDRFVSFDPAVWCRDPAKGIPPRCALDPTEQPGSPPFFSGMFGVYDERSKMNASQAQGICDADEPDDTSGLPTPGDLSAVSELYFGRTASWAPFQPIGRVVSPGQPFGYELSPGVDPVGVPAVAEWTAPFVEIFVRGSDHWVYTTRNELTGGSFRSWTGWSSVGGEKVDSDPAVAFLDETTLYLAARAAGDGAIILRGRRGGSWGPWFSIGAPATGAASTPALAATDDGALIVLVVGTDGHLYRRSCTDPNSGCVATAGDGNSWIAYPSPPSGWLVGKPTAVWVAGDDEDRLVVGAVGADHSLHWFVHALAGSGWGGWATLRSVELSPEDPEPSLTVVARGGFNEVGFFVRDRRGLLVTIGTNDVAFVLGGLLASSPGAVAVTRGTPRIDVVAMVDDHGRRGVWWKFHGGYTPPCNVNVPGTCAVCGCGPPTALRCDR